MEETKDWNAFAVTGKVEDYLRYKGVLDTTTKDKENGDAGLGAGNRDGYKSDPCR